MVSSHRTALLPVRSPITGLKSSTSSETPSRRLSAHGPRRLSGLGGTLAGPVTAYVYDWNMLPLGQALWLKELETYMELPADAGPGELQPRTGHEPAHHGPAQTPSRAT